MALGAAGLATTARFGTGRRRTALGGGDRGRGSPRSDVSPVQLLQHLDVESLVSTVLFRLILASQPLELLGAVDIHLAVLEVGFAQRVGQFNLSRS